MQHNTKTLHADKYHAKVINFMNPALKLSVKIQTQKHKEFIIHAFLCLKLQY
jgi:hypothetical protein